MQLAKAEQGARGDSDGEVTSKGVNEPSPYAALKRTSVRAHTFEVHSLSQDLASQLAWQSGDARPRCVVSGLLAASLLSPSVVVIVVSSE